MVRFDYKRKENKPGFCEIYMWEQADSGVIDPNPQKQLIEDDVPQEEVLKRITELDNHYNKRN